MCYVDTVAEKSAAGAPESEIEVSAKMADEGARALADMFEYAVAHDWLTKERASDVYRR
jgi:hypothetical protein